MPTIDEAPALAIPTFLVDPYLLGVEADQIAQLPRPAGQHQPSYRNSDITAAEMLDLRPASDPPSATKTQRSRVMMVDRSGEVVGYRVDERGDLITVELRAKSGRWHRSSLFKNGDSNCGKSVNGRVSWWCSCTSNTSHKTRRRRNKSP